VEKGALSKGREGAAEMTGAEQKQRQPHGERSSSLAADVIPHRSDK